MMPIPKHLSAGQVALRPHRAGDLAVFERFMLDPDATRYAACTEAQRTVEGELARCDVAGVRYVLSRADYRKAGVR